MKKLLFSLFALFSLFLVNDNVFAYNIEDDLYLSQEKYYELSDFITLNYGSDIMGHNGERSNQIWLTKVYYSETYMLKTYYVIQYEKLLDSFLWEDDNDTWALYMQNYVEIIIIERYENEVLAERFYSSEYTSEGKGYVFHNYLLLKNLDNISNSLSAFHFALSYEPITIYTNSDKTEKYLFYQPDYNFDKNITAETLKNNPDQAYDDYYADTNEPNQNIFERIWGVIVNIFNTLVEGFKNMIDGILSLPEKIGNTLSSLFGGFKLDEDAFKDKLDILMNDINNKFGFIAQTFDILIDVFNRFLSIKSGNHVINIPEIREPISNNTLINATSFDFDYVLSKNNISYLHTIYLSFVDVIILFSLVRYGLKQFNRIFGGVKQ